MSKRTRGPSDSHLVMIAVVQYCKQEVQEVLSNSLTLFNGVSISFVPNGTEKTIE